MFRGGPKGNGRVKPGELSRDGGVGRHCDHGDCVAANYVLTKQVKKEKKGG